MDMLMKNTINKLKSIEKNSIMLLAIAVVIFIIMGILEPRAFLGFTNIQGMLTQLPEFGLISLGMMLAMVSGGIDLSLVGIANLSGITAASVMIATNNPYSIIIGCIVGLAVGTVCGCINGLLIGKLQIPPMLVTLCTLQLFTGCGLMITRGPAITGIPEGFAVIGSGTLFGIPLSFIIFLVMVLFLHYLLKYSVYGKHVSYMGTNSTTSYYSGINNLAVTIKTYLLSGVFGSVAGLIMVSRYNSAKTDYGSSYTLLSLLIVVLGGTRPSGGKGSAIGVLLSVIVLQLVSSAFNIMRVDAALKTFVWGIILIVVVAIGIKETGKNSK